MLKRRDLLVWPLPTLIGLSGCGGSNSGSESPPNSNDPQKSTTLQWNEEILAIVKLNMMTPPVSARAMAMVNTAAYDAWAPYHGKAVASLPGGANRVVASNETDKSISINYAIYRVAVDVLPWGKVNFEKKLRNLGLDPNNQALDNSPAGIGNLAAKLLLEYRAQDQSNQNGTLEPGEYKDYTNYRSVNTPYQINNPSRWQPLLFSTGLTPNFSTPHWGRVVPFSLSSGAALRPSVTLPQFGSQEYKTQADHILDLTQKLSDQDKASIEYWSDGPNSEQPPGHWNLFAQTMAIQRQHNLDQDVLLFFLQSNAAFDASIACWDCKRHYDYVRPITAIRSLYRGQNIQGFLGKTRGLGLTLGENWNPWQPEYFTTPPHPDFTSGHSTFSAACAEVLQRFFATDTFNGSFNFAKQASKIEQNTPTQTVQLTWSTLSDAVNACSLSRVLGGIHFEQACNTGQSMGRSVGRLVWEKVNGLLNGQRV
jgi:PAP2 superfamily